MESWRYLVAQNENNKNLRPPRTYLLSSLLIASNRLASKLCSKHYQNLFSPENDLHILNCIVG